MEVFDNRSDVVVYDVEKHEIVTAPHLSSEENMETFPAFSSDGRRLYFCSAPACRMPESYRKIRYNLQSIAFDPEKRSFGQTIDTLYNANEEGRSAKLPRVSPDGRFLMYTVSDYGNFSIWHKDADLRLLDMLTGKTDSLLQVNSNDVESYHSWSSNSRGGSFSAVVGMTGCIHGLTFVIWVQMVFPANLSCCLRKRRTIMNVLSSLSIFPNSFAVKSR